MKINTIFLAKEFISSVLKKGSIAVDATMGRGNDTIFLCELVGNEGKVFAFDIQQEALNSTTQKLNQFGFIDRVELVLDGHENIDKYINENVDLVVFNLGYLPKGDHNLATKHDTTVVALQKAMKLLKVGGAISLCVYQGGDTGFIEKDMVLQFLKNLDYNKFTVLVSEFFNRPNFPPIFIKIIKDSN